MLFTPFQTSLAEGAVIFMVILYVAAIIGGIILHFTFLSGKNAGKYTGFLGGLYDYLSFRKLCIESILRLFYIISVCVISITAVIVLFSGFSSSVSFGSALWNFILVGIMGNLILRIIYELGLLSVIMCKNIIEINHRLGETKLKMPVFEDGQETLKPGMNTIHTDQPEREQEGKAPYCRNCGAKIDREDSRFCTKCGHPR